MSNGARVPGASYVRRCLSVLALTVAVVSLVSTTSGVEAGKGWCRVDPIFIIDGQIVDVFIGSELRALTTTTGPIKLNLTVPKGVKVTHLLSDLGFGRGYKITITKSDDLVATKHSIPVKIEVYVPAKSDSLPVSVFFSPRLLGILSPVSVNGSANQWVSLSSHV